MKRKEIKKNRKIPHKSRLIEFREIEETACVPATPEVYVAKRSRGGNQVRRETNRTRIDLDSGKAAQILFPVPGCPRPP